MNVIQYIILIILTVVSIFPFFWMVIAATNKSVDVTRGTLLPGTYLAENLRHLMESDLQYMTAFKNSLIIAVVTTTLAMVVSSAAGYAFEVYKSKVRDRVFSIVLLSMMVPFAALMVPLFRLFSKFNKIPGLSRIGLNSSGAVIIVAVATAFLIFFFRQNTKTFPKELIEASRIDGLGEFGIFTRIFMPTMKSTYAAAIVVTFMTSWNNYLWPLLVIRSSDKYTLTLGLNTLINPYGDNYSLLVVGSFFSIVPIFILFVCFQKYFIEGMTAGAVKE